MNEIFEFFNFPELISCNFSMLTAHFQTKGTFIREGRGQNPLLGANIGPWLSFLQYIIMLK